MLVKFFIYGENSTERFAFHSTSIDTWDKLVEALQCVHPTTNLQPTVSIRNDASIAFKIHPSYWPLISTSGYTFHVTFDTTSPLQPVLIEAPPEMVLLSITFQHSVQVFTEPVSAVLYSAPRDFTLSRITTNLEMMIQQMYTPLIPFRAMLQTSGLHQSGTLDQLGTGSVHQLIYALWPLLKGDT